MKKDNILFIINSAPYGSENLFNALRLAIMLQDEHKDDVELKLFLLSDAVVAGLDKQDPDEGYNVQQALEIVSGFGAEIKLCKTCTNARGITDLPLADGVEIGSLGDLAKWTLWADKVLSF